MLQVGAGFAELEKVGQRQPQAADGADRKQISPTKTIPLALHL
jgi:hypothetical protein